MPLQAPRPCSRDRACRCDRRSAGRCAREQAAQPSGSDSLSTMGSFAELRERGDDLHARVHVQHLFGQAHLHVAVHHPRAALGVVADEIERRRAPSLRGAVLQELAQECRRLSRCRAGGGRSADLRAGQRALHRRAGVVVELVVLLGRAAPVGDVRLVPDLPIPLRAPRPCRSAPPSAAPTGAPARPTWHSPWADSSSPCRHPAWASSRAYGCGLVESASGMKPISTNGRAPART